MPTMNVSVLFASDVLHMRKILSLGYTPTKKDILHMNLYTSAILPLLNYILNTRLLRLNLPLCTGYFSLSTLCGHTKCN